MNWLTSLRLIKNPSSIYLQVMSGMVHNVLKTSIGVDIASPAQFARNLSFTLQNGHFSVSYLRPYLPSVAEIGCIHCKPAKPLPKVSYFGDISQQTQLLFFLDFTVPGGLCQRCRRGRFRLRFDGHFGAHRKYATAALEDSGRCLCKAGSVSCALEVRGNIGRLRLAGQCQDRALVAAAGHFG